MLIRVCQIKGKFFLIFPLLADKATYSLLKLARLLGEASIHLANKHRSLLSKVSQIKKLSCTNVRSNGKENRLIYACVIFLSHLVNYNSFVIRII